MASTDRTKIAPQPNSDQGKHVSVKRPQGGQKGNTDHFQHGAYSLLAIRKKGERPNGNTKLGRAFRAQEREYIADLGGVEDLSLAMRQVVNDTVWCDFLLATCDYQLRNRVRLTKKDKPHPLIDLRMRVAAHRRDNYKLIGLKRVTKEATWDDLKLDKATKEDDDEPQT